jgi:PAS domain S-box-containing protein
MSSVHSRRLWSIASPSSPLHAVILVCLVASLSYLAAKLGGALVLRPQMVWPLWPGCAFLVAVLLLAPRRIWPILIAAGFAGFVLYDLQAGLTLRSTAWLILSDTIEVLIAVLGVSYSFEGVPRLNSVKSLAKYSFFAIILAPLSAAFIGTVAFGGNDWTRWRIDFFTEALALLTLTPAILSWVSTKQEWERKPRAFYVEAAALIAGLVLLGYVAFMAPGRSSLPALLYSLLPFLLWSALRFGVTGISTSMVAVAFLSIWGAVHGRGPFTGSGPLHNVLSLQLFLFFAATPFMVLAVLVEERKQAEQVVRESQSRLSAIVASAMDAIITVDNGQRIVLFNAAAEKVFGCPAHDAIGNSIDRFFPHRVRDEHSAHIRRFGEAGVAHQAMGKLDALWGLRANGEEFPIEASISHVEVGGKQLFTVVIRDVTERRRAEEAVRESEERFRDLAEQSRTTHWEVDPQGLFTYVSHVSQTSWGYRPNEVVGRMHFYKLHPEEGREAFKAAVFAVVERKQSFRDVVHAVGTKDGRILWGSTNGIPMLNADGTLRGYRGSCTDITERKRAEGALKESEDRYRDLVEHSQDLMCTHDLKGRLLSVNPAVARALGYEIGELLQMSIPDLLASRDRPRFDAFVAQIRRDGVSAGSMRVITRAGEERIWEYHNTLRTEDVPEPIVRGMARDVTDRKRAQKALHQKDMELAEAQRSVSRRLIEAQEKERTRIARDLHDDIGQRLALLTIGLDQLQQNGHDLTAETRSRMAELREDTSKLANDVQSLSHELHSSKLEYLGITAAMRGFCKEFGEQQKVEVDFRTHDLPSPSPPDISLCLFRVLQEALHNSAKHSGVRYFEVRLSGTSDEVHLTVSDSGAGFDREAAREGRGLGLISMEERLKLLKGTLSIESQPQRGTTIQARVPLRSESDSMRAAG